MGPSNSVTGWLTCTMHDHSDSDVWPGRRLMFTHFSLLVSPRDMRSQHRCLLLPLSRVLFSERREQLHRGISQVPNVTSLLACPPSPTQPDRTCLWPPRTVPFARIANSSGHLGRIRIPQATLGLLIEWRATAVTSAKRVLCCSEVGRPVSQPSVRGTSRQCICTSWRLPTMQFCKFSNSTLGLLGLISCQCPGQKIVVFRCDSQCGTTLDVSSCRRGSWRSGCCNDRNGMLAMAVAEPARPRTCSFTGVP